MVKKSENDFINVSLWLMTLVLFFVWADITAYAAGEEDLLLKGEEVFKRECVVCHGTKGVGDGTAAYLLFPKPRNLTKGIFKVRSTPTGEPPTDEDMLRTVTQGLPGSAMPSFRALPEPERKAVVQYVKKIADMTEPPESIITVANASEHSGKLIAQGKKLFDKMKCWECHGNSGKGDGPSSLTAKDEEGYPSPPNNFTRGIYKGGGEDSDIYLRFTTGMDGTPMPSYEASLKEDERWALVQYVRSLAGSKVAVQPGGGDVVVKKVTGEIKADPMSPLWEKAEAAKIPLMLLWQRQEVVDAVNVRAVHNGKDIAFLLEWEDLSPQMRFTRTQDFNDCAAVEFPIYPKNSTLFSMGDNSKPVNIWYWRADRQLDIDKGRFQDSEDTYAGMVADDYQLAGDLYPKDKDKPQVQKISAVENQDPVYVTGWGAGNFASLPKRMSPVEDLNAEGFGTLSAKGINEQNVSGHGIWDNGKWKVVFIRALASDEDFDVQIKPGQSMPVAFAVWDGANGDRNGQKAVTPWYNLKIEN